MGTIVEISDCNMLSRTKSAFNYRVETKVGYSTFASDYIYIKCRDIFDVIFVLVFFQVQGYKFSCNFEYGVHRNEMVNYARAYLKKKGGGFVYISIPKNNKTNYVCVVTLSSFENLGMRLWMPFELFKDYSKLP